MERMRYLLRRRVIAIFGKKKLFVCTLLLFIIMSSCSKKDTEMQTESPFAYQDKQLHIENPMQLKETAITEIEHISLAKGEYKQYIVGNQKAYIIILYNPYYGKSVAGGWHYARKIYSYDFKTEKLVLKKEFKEKVGLVDYIEFENASYYAVFDLEEEEPGKVKIMKEKDGRQEVLHTITNDNYSEFRPRFTVNQGILYYFLCDVKAVTGKQEQYELRQKMISRENDNEKTLFSFHAPYAGYHNWSQKEGSYLGTTEMYVQPSGTILFQEVCPDKQVLHYLINGKWKTHTVAKDEYVRGYLLENVILYKKSEDANYILDLKTKKRKIIDTVPEHIEFSSQLSDNLMYFSGNFEGGKYMWIDAKGNLKIENADLFGKLNKGKEASIRIEADQGYVLCSVIPVVDEMNDTQRFYHLEYPVQYLTPA